jgi:mono/diheme cytochrome c family protein
MLVAAVASLAWMLTACSGGAAASATAGQLGATTQGGAPQVASVSRTGRPGTTAAQDPDLVAKGKVIFEQTAGGVGCQYCHGLDGKGKSEFASPDIRGKQAEDVVQAMATRTLMAGVKLSDPEVRAVVAYLGTLP